MKANTLEKFSKIMCDVNNAISLEHLFQLVLTQSLESVNANTGFIALVERITDQLQIQTAIVDGERLPSFPNNYLTQLHSYLREVTGIGSLSTPADSALSSAQSIDNSPVFICVPIASGKRILGVIGIKGAGEHTFSLEDKQFLTMIGEHVVFAIESHVLRRVGTELSTLSVKEILSKITQIACFLSAANASAVLLIDNREDENICSARFPISEADVPFVPRPDGLTHQVTSSCTPLLIQDAQQHPKVRPTTKAQGTQSILGVPLLTTQAEENGNVRAIGALFVDSSERRTFDEHETMILQNLANLAAVAIGRARHMQSLRRLNQSYLEITQAQQDVQSLAVTLLNQAAKLVNAKGGRLCLLDRSGIEVDWGVMTNFPERPVKIKMEATVGVFGHVLRTRRPYAVADYQTWPDRRMDFDKYGFTAVAGVPILYQNHLWGVILVHDTVEGRIFDQEDLNVLASLGNLAAVAFENTRRFDNERMIESAAAAVIAIDGRGRITQFNQQAEEMLQYKKEEVLGQPITKFYCYAADPFRIQQLMLNSPNGKIKEYTTYLKSKYGQEIPIKLSASLLFDYEGKRAGSVGFFHDQRRNNARAMIAGLLDKNEIFQAIVDQAKEMTGAPQFVYLALNIDNKLQIAATYPREVQTTKKRLWLDSREDGHTGIAGRAFQTGDAQLVADVKLDADYIAFDDLIQAELAVPIKTRQETIGVIVVQHQEKGAFHATDQYNLETLAQFAAIAIQNAELYAESQIDKQRFKTIAEIIREAAQNPDINELLRNTCHRLETVFAEKEAIASIRLYDKGSGLLRFEPEWHERFHLCISKEINGTRTTQRLDEGICGFVATTRRSQNVGDVERDKNFIRLISDTKSEICVPIHLDETQELIGVLDVQSPFLNAFTRNDLEYLELLAGHLAVDFDKAKLFERARRGEEAHEAISRVRGVVTDSAELTETLNQVVQHVYQLALSRGKQVNSVILRLVRGSKRVLAAAQPPELLNELQRNLREVEIREGVKGKIGISGRAIITRQTQNVGNVTTDPDYLLLSKLTCSELAIPIIIKDQVIAAMDIECAEKDAFNENDEQVFGALAAQAGIAIHTANQYNTLERRNKHLQANYEASRIISRGIAVNLYELLYRILEQAVKLIQPAGGKNVNIAVIQLYDEGKSELRQACVYPLAASTNLRSGIGATRSIKRAPNHRIGISGRAVLECKSQRVNDVSLDTDYYGVSASTRSELDVLLLDQDSKILGTLGLESTDLRAFDEEDEQVLQNLADLAVIAIRNSQQYQDLEDTKATLALHTAVAWLGAARRTWDHKTAGHIAAIEQYIKLLEGDLDSGCSDEKIRERLTKIKLVIDKTREQRITTPLSPETGRELVEVDDFVRQWIEKVYWDTELATEIPYQLKLNGRHTQIRVNPGWFKLAIDNIANNALRAMKGVAVKRLIIKTERRNNLIEIVVTDTGPGIPRDIQMIYGKSMIKKEQGAQGEGVGLMLSNMIVQTYEGELGILETGTTGTSIFIRLPCA